MVGSCEKEEIVLLEDNNLVETEVVLPESEIESYTDFVSPERDAAIRNYFSDGKKSEKGIAAIIDSILLNPAKFVRDPSSNHDVVTYLVDGKDSTKLHNLVFSFSGDTLKEALHYAFDLGTEFGGKLAKGEVSFGQYEGTVAINPANSIEEVLQKDGLGDCFNLSVVNGNVRFGTINVDPNVGGFGPGKPSGPSGPIGGTTYTGGESDGSGSSDGPRIYICYEVVENPVTGGVVVWRINCQTGHRIGGPDAFTDDNDGGSEETTTKNKKSDCGTMLNMLGIVARPGDLNVSLAENRRREKLLNGTSFQANETVSRILDFNLLQLCEGDRNDCVRAQLITYVNSELDAHFDGTLHAGVTNTILDEHLIRIAEAVYQSDVNNNTSLIRSVEFVLRNFSNELVTNNLAEILLQAAILHVNNPDNFTGNAAAYITVLNKTNGELSSEHTTWLMVHPEVLVRLAESSITNDDAKAVIQKVIDVSVGEGPQSIIGVNMVGLYDNLNDKSHFFNTSEDQITVFAEISDLFEGIDEGVADILFNDYSEFNSREQAFPFLLPYITKIAVRAGIAAILELGAQFCFEYALGGHDSVEDAWENWDVNWFSLGASMLEAQLPAGQAALGSGVIAGLQSLYDALASDEPITLGTFAWVAAQAGLGYVTSKFGDYLDPIISKFRKYGFKRPYDGLKTYFGSTMNSLVRNFQPIRREMMQAIWRETNIASATRGQYVEDFLSITRFNGSDVTWTNALGETNGPVDFYSISSSTAISVKSAQALSNINPVSYFDQIYRGGIRDGITLNGVQTRFDNLRIDVVVPDGISFGDIDSAIDEAYTRIARRIQLNPSMYPSLNYT